MKTSGKQLLIHPWFSVQNNQFLPGTARDVRGDYSSNSPLSESYMQTIAEHLLQKNQGIIQVIKLSLRENPLLLPKAS